MQFADHSEVALERLNAERVLEARRARSGGAAAVTPIFTHHLEVRFRDCDAMGHVNNAVYLTYLEESRLPSGGRAAWRGMPTTDCGPRRAPRRDRRARRDRLSPRGSARHGARTTSAWRR